MAGDTSGDAGAARPPERWREVARVGQVRANDVIPIEVDGLQLALGRDGERYFAVQRRCAHHGADLTDGIVSRGHLVCPQHGWRFSTATGRHDAASEYCLTRYAVRVVDDRIEIDPQPVSTSES